MRQFIHAFVCLGLIGISCVSARADAAPEPVNTTIELSPAGPEIPQDFAGFSFETAQLLPDKEGKHYFGADRAALIALFKTLGIKHVRVGGNSVDSTNTAVPAEADIRAFFEFAQAAGIKVIYSVRLHDGEPQSAAKIAAFIHNNFAGNLDCFAIGNEPGYYKDPDVYRAKWLAIRDAMVAAVPGAKFCGPDDNPKPAVLTNAVQSFAGSGLVMLTMHSYPGGCAYKNPSLKTPIDQLIPNDPAEARVKLLSPAMRAEYEKVLKAGKDAVAGTSLPIRLDESNSYWYGGLHGASDTYAAALWSLDYLYWWASHGARGLNFHTGERVGGGDHTVICRYASFLASGPGYEAKPVAYGLKMFDLGAEGALIPVNVPAAETNLSLYATKATDGSLSVTLINKSHGLAASEKAVQLALNTPAKISSARVIYLTAPAGDIAATNGLAIGGAAIANDGSWQGQWKPLHSVPGTNLTVNLPPASAAVVQIQLAK